MRLQLPDRGERGAIAVMTAFLTVVLFAAAALGVDISTQVNQRQQLHDTIDAAAHAGAYDLPASGTLAQTDAVANALVNDPAAPTPTVVFYCVVASLAGAVDTTQIPSSCNPASAGGSFTGYKCNAKICSIPCHPTVGDVCNTISVSGTKPVPFSFAPVIGITQGGTGSVTSVACKGACGTIPPNPMDVAVVADRTGSMSSTDITAMITGIESMFQVMTPAQQYVALGTIGRSATSPASTICGSGTQKALSEPSASDTAGPWVPVPFTTDYLNSGTTTLNTGSNLVQAVNCLKNSSGSGTHLASAMKGAARYLLGYDPNNLGSLPVQTGVVRKAIIFETDGAPNEAINGGSTTLSVSGDIGSTSTTTDAACNNLTTVAANAKAAGILVVTVAFNPGTTKCSTASGSATLVATLAAAASPAPSGAASTANNDCTTVAGRNLENADGDYFFCAASGTNMAPIFKTALGQLAKGIKFIQLP
jgi:hypothetical protein